MKNANYRKYNDRTHNSSTYHKKDGTPMRGILKEETRKQIQQEMNENQEIQEGDSAVFRGRLVTVESVNVDGTETSYWVVDQNGEAYEAKPDDFEHVY